MSTVSMDMSSDSPSAAPEGPGPTLLYLSLMGEGGGQVHGLSLHRRGREGGVTYTLALEPGNSKHDVQEASMEGFLKDVSALEPNRWREGENLARVAPPFKEFLGVEDDMLLRAMALMMRAARVSTGEPGPAADTWLLGPGPKGLTITGPARQYRRIYVLDPDSLPEEELSLVDKLWREGFLMELVLNPRREFEGHLQAWYLTPPWNAPLYPANLALGGGANALWKRLLEAMKNAPQTNV